MLRITTSLLLLSQLRTVYPSTSIPSTTGTALQVRCWIPLALLLSRCHQVRVPSDVTSTRRVRAVC